MLREEEVRELAARVAAGLLAHVEGASAKTMAVLNGRAVPDWTDPREAIAFWGEGMGRYSATFTAAFVEGFRKQRDGGAE